MNAQNQSYSLVGLLSYAGFRWVVTKPFLTASTNDAKVSIETSFSEPVYLYLVFVSVSTQNMLLPGKLLSPSQLFSIL